MTKLSFSLIFSLQLILSSAFASDNLSMTEAVALAEKFVVTNGYADVSATMLLDPLTYESIERYTNRSEILSFRYNTLSAVAIGAKMFNSGWGIAFDYTSEPSTGGCRVVTMNSDGTNIRVQHQDGLRNYWVGFDQE